MDLKHFKTLVILKKKEKIKMLMRGRIPKILRKSNQLSKTILKVHRKRVKFLNRLKGMNLNGLLLNGSRNGKNHYFYQTSKLAFLILTIKQWLLGISL